MTGIRTNVVKRRGEAEYRERFFVLLLLSLFIHAALILLLTLFFAERAGRMGQKPATSSELPPPEVTLEIPPPPTPEHPIVTASESSEKVPKNAPFQSDQNTAAASELPAQGSAPVPTQQGVSQTSLELQNQRYTPGEHAATSAGNPAPPKTPAPPSPPSPAKSQDQKPKPNATPAPTATPQNSATPQPTPLTPPPPNDVKLLELPEQEPSPHPSPLEQATLPQVPQQAAPPVIPGTPGPKKGYQPETRQTVIMGNISNRGRSSVAADATPIGRYKKAVADAIGSRWYYYVNESMGLLSIGTVNVTFKVSPSGQVTGLRVVSSNSNESLTDCSLRSIMDAKLPPIPPDVAGTLQNGRLEIDYTFTIY